MAINRIAHNLIENQSPEAVMRQQLEQHYGFSFANFPPGELQRRYQIMLIDKKDIKRCHICGGNKFAVFENGNIVCLRCHPKPKGV